MSLAARQQSALAMRALHQRRVWASDSLEPRAPMRMGCREHGRDVTCRVETSLACYRSGELPQPHDRPYEADPHRPRHRNQLRRDRRVRRAPGRRTAASRCCRRSSAPSSRSTPPSAAWCRRSPPAPTSRPSTAWSREAMRGRRGSACDDLDGVAATAGPGLVGGVMVGLAFGKAVALARDLPLVAVNHLEGHAVSARLGADDRPIPSCCCWSPAATASFWKSAGVGACTRLGTTIDDAAGEAFDKIAKSLGLPYPGGPALEKLARGGDPRRFDLPRAPAGPQGLRFLVLGPQDRRRAAGRRRPPREQDRARPGRRRPVRHRPPAVRAHRPGHESLTPPSHPGRGPALRGGRRGGGQRRGEGGAAGRTAPTTASASTPRRWPTAPTTPP